MPLGVPNDATIFQYLHIHHKQAHTAAPAEQAALPSTTLSDSLLSDDEHEDEDKEFYDAVESGLVSKAQVQTLTTKQSPSPDLGNQVKPEPRPWQLSKAQVQTSGTEQSPQ